MSIDYKAILQQFTSDDDSRDWMSEPFNFNGLSFGVNCHILACAPNIDLPECTRLGLMSSVWGIAPNMRKEIDVKELEAKIWTLPTVDTYSEHLDECEACGGDGLVEWETDINCRTYYNDFDCPICEGTGEAMVKGEVTGKAIAENECIKIGNSAFTPELILKVLAQAKPLGESKMYLIRQDMANMPSLFEMGEMKFLVMPKMMNVGADYMEIELK